MPKLIAFNGGLHIATAQNLINANEGAVYKNIDHIPGTLKPLADKVGTSITGAKQFGHFFTQDQTWYFSDTPKDWVEYQERLYIGNRDGESTKVIDGTESKLGIDAPGFPSPQVTGISSDQSPLVDIALIVWAFVPGDLPDDTTYSYRVVNEDAVGKFTDSAIFTVTAGVLANPVSIRVFVGEQDAFTTTAHVYRQWTDLEWHLAGEILHNPASNPPNSGTFIDSIHDISANANITALTLEESGNLNGVIEYAYTFYNSATGLESVPFLIGGRTWLIDGRTEITGLKVSTDPQVDEKKLYRIGGDLTAYHLVVTLDNAITTYDDNIADIDLPGPLLESGDNYPAPENLSFLIEAYAMLFAADGDKLRFTNIGEPEVWPLTNFLDFPRKIKGIGKTPIGLLVFTTYQTFLVTGTGPLALAQQSLTDSQGCISGDSVVNVQGAVYWGSTDGICISNGGSVKVWTRPKLGKAPFYKVIGAVVYDQQYMLLHESNFTESGYESIILDAERGAVKTADKDIQSYLTANDKLYGYKDALVFELHTSPNNLSMDYLSPWFVGPALAIPKVYKNFYMVSDGEITIEIIIDGLSVITHNKTGFDNHQLKIPSENTRGKYVQFKITGTGTVYELNWQDGNANA